jgi:hypothetical protein
MPAWDLIPRKPCVLNFKIGRRWGVRERKPELLKENEIQNAEALGFPENEWRK